MISFKRVAIVVLAGIALLYPFLIYLGMQRFEPRYVGLVAAMVYLLRTLIMAKTWRTRLLATSALAGFTLAVWVTNSEYLLTLIPALISLIALVAFTHSYLEPPTIPAKFALKSLGTLSADQLQYTNKVTLVWMAFFIVNGSIALYTALFCSREVWTLYNGFISYLLIGSLFLLEFCYRTFVVLKRPNP